VPIIGTPCNRFRNVSWKHSLAMTMPAHPASDSIAGKR